VGAAVIFNCLRIPPQDRRLEFEGCGCNKSTRHELVERVAAVNAELEVCGEGAKCAKAEESAP